MIEVFNALKTLYSGSDLDALTPHGMFSYIVPPPEEGVDPGDYVVMYMDKSPILNTFNMRTIDVMIIVEGASRYEKGQKPINDIKEATLGLYDNTQELVVTGYEVIQVTATHLQQVLDDTDIDNLVWRYPVAFGIKLTKTGD